MSYSTLLYESTPEFSRQTFRIPKYSNLYIIFENTYIVFNEKFT